MSLIKLYDKAECPFCWKVRLALVEVGLEAEVIDYQSPLQRAQWESVSPRKTVPVMLSNGIAIYESNVILEYLEELTGRLLPETTADRVQARLLNQYSDATIGAALREVIFEKRGKPEVEWNQARIETGIAAFRQALLFLADQLGEKAFFTGRYSFPECALTARFGLAEAYGVAIPQDMANLQAWFARMKDRPSYRLTAPESLHN